MPLTSDRTKPRMPGRPGTRPELAAVAPRTAPVERAGPGAGEPAPAPPAAEDLLVHGTFEARRAAAAPAPGR